MSPVTHLAEDLELHQLADSGLLSWLLLGLIAGVVAKVLLPGRDPGGLVGTTFIGIAGAFIGTWLSSTFLDKPVRHNLAAPQLWVAAVAGALVLLVIYRILFGHSRRKR
ncbi:GlsB/YeaQ/YmgE family stress response membrane protein [Streptomyces sp. NPDC005438]|uniref:GlsB/YeaQ/YmgE family stress response membrane protein n=1 Tax=Streptomyces sp. NPDC005438 TaxID=3156880 RepID=UPI0033A403D4